jgi:hypothetical protein
VPERVNQLWRRSCSGELLSELTRNTQIRASLLNGPENGTGGSIAGQPAKNMSAIYRRAIFTDSNMKGS